MRQRKHRSLPEGKRPHRIITFELLTPEQRPAVAELSIVHVKRTDARGLAEVLAWIQANKPRA